MTLNSIVKCGSVLLVLVLRTWIPSLTEAQSPRPNLEGMWSDPPATPVDSFCSWACTDAGIDRLNALLDDPAMEDPWSLREPLVLKKVWRWAPEQRIAPYEDCERPTEFKRRVKP